MDSVGGEARGAGPAVLDGPGSLVGAGAKAFAGASVRGGSNTKPESTFVSTFLMVDRLLKGLAV